MGKELSELQKSILKMAYRNQAVFINLDTLEIVTF